MNKTISDLKEEMLRIISEWNGDNSGRDEDRSGTAEEILEHIKNIEELLEEL